VRYKLLSVLILYTYEINTKIKLGQPRQAEQPRQAKLM